MRRIAVRAVPDLDENPLQGGLGFRAVFQDAKAEAEKFQRRRVIKRGIGLAAAAPLFV
ncbi:MAG: hypothetical protein P3W90_004460 [Paracoccus sp. (in: a-proteobacteria)]|nr:hypothetical protein [Paracoccus sp. (in: a-proteobacteria)]